MGSLTLSGLWHLTASNKTLAIGFEGEIAKTCRADGLWAGVEPARRRSRPSRRAAGYGSTTARCSRASCSCSRGHPLAARYTAANLNDSKMLEEMVDAI